MSKAEKTIIYVAQQCILLGNIHSEVWSVSRSELADRAEMRMRMQMQTPKTKMDVEQNASLYYGETEQ